MPKQKVKKYQDKDWLKRQYVKKEKSVSALASELNTSVSTIYRKLREYNIEARGNNQKGYSINPEKTNYRNEKWLTKQLVDKNKKQAEIAEECNVSPQTISVWAKRFDIDSTAQTLENGKKKCSSCDKWLTQDKFHPSSKTSTGLKSRCKKCINKADRRKRKMNPTVKINHNLSITIERAIQDKQGIACENLLPYTLQELKQHLENQFKDGMTWDNYGKFGWHIDHIIPKSKFNFVSRKDKEFQECWALNNLQPLWAEENLSKGDKLLSEVENA